MATGESRNDLNNEPSTTTGSPSPDTAIEIPSPEVCVICLDRISEKAIALPCRHNQFDFPCLGTWLQQQRVCPLCKRQVRAIRYDASDGEGKIFALPAEDVPRRSVQDISHRRSRNVPYRGRARDSRQPRRDEHVKDTSLDFRRDVYRHQLFSLRVGTNRISRYRNITPASFLQEERLISRARIWIRRELSVFDFLDPESPSFGKSDRRASNAEYLLEYIIAILKSVDLKGSTGQATELLKDFLGGENALLFLHELEAWLRSPHEKLADWDRDVQYANDSELINNAS